MALARPEKVQLFAEGAVSTLRLIVYLTLAMIIMVIDYRAGYLQALRSFSSRVIEPAYRIAGFPAEAARAGRLAIATQQHLAEENRELREALLLAQVRLNRMAALSEQNERLKVLLDVQNNLGLGVRLARLIDIDLDPFRHRVVLDAGASQGVQVGQPLLDATGIMGQVVEALPNTSVAMLISDPTHAIPVTVERTGLRTIAYGTGAIDRLQLPNIPISADVKVGDRLVTSGLGGRFPAGFPVGEVREIRNDESGMFAAATARPAAALDRSGDVLLLQDLPQPMGPPVPGETAPAAAPTPAPVEPRP
ncbi:MAG: rod shape-determining protein MreC [Xanthomonadales bacterium]|nr:rod shape-determining protein MreC [Xanthomonadales bacterium]